MTEKFKRKYTVGSGDMDINYKMTKIAAAKYFQESFAMYSSKRKLAAFDLCEKNIVWVISDMRLDFTGNMPYWSEEFEVEIWISEKTKIRTYADFRIFYKDKEIAKGDSCWYLLDMKTRRPVKSIDILQAFGVCNEKVFAEQEIPLYKIEGNKISEKEHQVTVRDLDFNKHVNNLSYMWLALETIPAEILEKYSAKSYSVKFVREAYLSDIIVSEVYQNGDNYTVRIFNKNDNSDVCFIFAEFMPKTDFGGNPREAGVIF